MATELTNGFGKVYLTIEPDPTNGWIYANWLGYQSFAGVVAGANIILDALARHACPYLLNDNRQVLGPWDHAVEWIVQDWAPRAIAGGVTHFAHVVPASSLAMQSARAMRLGVNGELEMQLFEDMTAARTWLQRMQQAANVAGR